LQRLKWVVGHSKGNLVIAMAISELQMSNFDRPAHRQVA
jgi:hypothetical protein